MLGIPAQLITEAIDRNAPCKQRILSQQTPGEIRIPQSEAPKVSSRSRHIEAPGPPVKNHYIQTETPGRIAVVLRTNIADIRKVNRSDVATFQEAKISLQKGGVSWGRPEGYHPNSPEIITDSGLQRARIMGLWQE